MADGMQTIVDFVEGRLDARTFERRLYGDPEIERILTSDPHLKSGTYVGDSVYLFAIQQDFSDPGGVLSVHGTLSDFLQRNHVPFQPSKVYSNRYRVLLSAQPRWLRADPGYIERHLLPEARGRTGRELRDWLRAELLKRFRYVKKRPHWLQSPQWPINENGPLVFLGQLRVQNYFHDEAAAYVFHDPKSGSCETIVQVR
jgi:hypothetical protein